ncbi:MAG: hypothetical protein QF805_24575, partial [Pirellulaceae bacterium]|nr:hypothetical protein [Pirellulaceae bacterium]
MTASAVNSAPDQARSLVGLARLQAAWSNPTLRKSLASVFDQALVSGVSFTTSVILGRNASQEELGVYFLALTIILVMRGVQAELITAPFTIFRQRMSSGRRVAYAQTTLTLQLLVTVASVVGFAIAA